MPYRLKEYLEAINAYLKGSVHVSEGDVRHVVDSGNLPMVVLETAIEEDGQDTTYEPNDFTGCGGITEATNIKVLLASESCNVKALRDKLIAQINSQDEFFVTSSGVDAAAIYLDEYGELLTNTNIRIIRLIVRKTEPRTTLCKSLEICKEDCCNG